MYESKDLSQREIDELLATATEAAMSALQKTWECETQLFWAAVDGDDLFTWLREDHPQLAACIWRLGLQKEFNKRIKAAVALMEDAELMVYRMDDASITHMHARRPMPKRACFTRLSRKNSGTRTTIASTSRMRMTTAIRKKRREQTRRGEVAVRDSVSELLLPSHGKRSGLFQVDTGERLPAAIGMLSRTASRGRRTKLAQ